MPTHAPLIGPCWIFFITLVANGRAGRLWAASLLVDYFPPALMAREVLRLEAALGKHCAVLAVTNQGAAHFNQARLALELSDVAQALAAGHGILSDPAYGEQNFIAVVGARVRLTQNLDKERGFVNGAMGVITQVFAPDIFVVKTLEGVLLLIHRVQQQRLKFLPVTYAYATTMRRAQGATLELVALWFDRRRPDSGYAYVGASRARTRTDVCRLGRLRRSDWRPVGGGDQVHLDLSVRPPLPTLVTEMKVPQKVRRRRWT